MYGYPASGSTLNQIPAGAIPADGGIQRGMKPFQTSNGGTGYYQVPILPGGGYTMGGAPMGGVGPMGAPMGAIGPMGGMMGGGAPMMQGMAMGSMGGGNMSPWGGYTQMMTGQMPQAQSGAQMYKGQSYSR